MLDRLAGSDATNSVEPMAMGLGLRQKRFFKLGSMS